MQSRSPFLQYKRLHREDLSAPGSNSFRAVWVQISGEGAGGPSLPGAVQASGTQCEYTLIPLAGPEVFRMSFSWGNWTLEYLLIYPLQTLKNRWIFLKHQSRHFMALEVTKNVVRNTASWFALCWCRTYWAGTPPPCEFLLLCCCVLMIVSVLYLLDQKWVQVQ